MMSMAAMGWARGLGLGLLAWCVGVALQLQQEALWSVMGYAVMLALALVFGLLLRRMAKPAWLGALAWCLVWAAASFAFTGLHAHTRSAAIDPALEGQDLDVVDADPAWPNTGVRVCIVALSPLGFG